MFGWNQVQAWLTQDQGATLAHNFDDIEDSEWILDNQHGNIKLDMSFCFGKASILSCKHILLSSQTFKQPSGSFYLQFYMKEK